MVARLKPVQQLRPQALPLKLLAVGAFTGVANVPSGERCSQVIWCASMVPLRDISYTVSGDGIPLLHNGKLQGDRCSRC